MATTLVVSGCSSSSSPAPKSSETSSPSASAGATVCASLTAAVNAAVHASWRAPTESDNGPVHNCSFGPADPGVLAVQVEDGMSHTGFVDNRAIVDAQGNVDNVSGLGDEAYSQTLNGATLVSVRQGEVGVAVQLQDGSKDDAVAIARAALSVLAK